jgi:hypothetical protein
MNKSKQTKRGHIWKKLKVAFAIFSDGEFRKISLKIFELEMRNISKIFPNSFDQKSQKNGIWFFKEHIKNMWSPTQKVKVAILKSVSRWFEKSYFEKNWT